MDVPEWGNESNEFICQFGNFGFKKVGILVYISCVLLVQVVTKPFLPGNPGEFCVKGKNYTDSKNVYDRYPTRPIGHPPRFRGGLGTNWY